MTPYEIVVQIVGLSSAEQASYLERLELQDPDTAAQVRERLAHKKSIEGNPEFPFYWDHEAFEIREEIGRGANGIVKLAWDKTLQRWVVLKIMNVDGGQTAFAVEGRSAAILQHDNIGAVYGAGVCNDRPFLCMEYIDGPSLAGKVREDGPVAPMEAARICCAIAEGIAYAHKQGVVHRDLKPANILLSRADGRIVIVDFGLAKLPEDLHSSKIVGTPAYMAPEQISNKDVGPAADVYAIGAILYALLAGRPPFDGERMEVFEAIKHWQPRPLRNREDLIQMIPISLDAIVRRCMRKVPEQRYRSSEALVKDLRRFMRGRMVRAHWSWPFEVVGQLAMKAGMLIFGWAVLNMALVMTFGWSRIFETIEYFRSGTVGAVEGWQNIATDWEEFRNGEFDWTEVQRQRQARENASASLVEIDRTRTDNGKKSLDVSREAGASVGSDGEQAISDEAQADIAVAASSQEAIPDRPSDVKELGVNNLYTLEELEKAFKRPIPKDRNTVIPSSPLRMQKEDN